jgi:hypothetical protein
MALDNVFTPIATLSKPVILSPKDKYPTAVLFPPDVLLINE